VTRVGGRPTGVQAFIEVSVVAAWQRKPAVAENARSGENPLNPD
jgi:hypothetical protein